MSMVYHCRVFAPSESQCCFALFGKTKSTLGLCNIFYDKSKLAYFGNAHARKGQFKQRSCAYASGCTLPG
eukprot:9051483-Pyramimonas_sp.AAC.1